AVGGVGEGAAGGERVGVGLVEGLQADGAVVDLAVGHGQRGGDVVAGDIVALHPDGRVRQVVRRQGAAAVHQDRGRAGRAGGDAQGAVVDVARPADGAAGRVVRLAEGGQRGGVHGHLRLVGEGTGARVGVDRQDDAGEGVDGPEVGDVAGEVAGP